MDPLLLLAPLSLAAGVNLYLTVLVTGLVVRFGWAADQLPESLDVLGSLPVLIAAGAMTLVEFFADKIPYLDSGWDLLHTFIRPVGAMLLALNVLPEGDPATTLALTLLTGAGALTSHSSKAGTRALVNTSPEPFSNSVVSVAEDVTVVALLALAMRYPVIATVIAVVALLLLVVFLWWLMRFARRVFGGIGRFLQGKRTSSAAVGSAHGLG